ncbi:MAG: von Willebrand factor type A domain-containing protein, partial [Bacteroidales bacterium]|nr:von Willebrand factor type A domain-containing protein [Bacteroidales bacterium]
MKKFILPCVLTIISASIVSCSMAEDGVSSFPGNYTSDGNTEIDGNSGDNFKEIKENDFVEASAQPTSTFSVDADGATYAYMRACIKRSCVPDPRAVRIEEYLNYFTFDYAEPEGEESVAINAELG